MTQELIEFKGHYFPVIYCKEQGVNWIFLCKYCNEIHYHGIGEGHRGAHCSDIRSPYYHTGYYLKLKVKQ